MKLVVRSDQTPSCPVKMSKKTGKLSFTNLHEYSLCILGNHHAFCRFQNPLFLEKKSCRKTTSIKQSEPKSGLTFFLT